MDGSWKGATAGSYILTAEATDTDGQTNTSTPVTIKVKADTEPPVISVSSATTVQWPANHQYYTLQVSDFVTGSSDNCGSFPDAKIKQVTSDEAVNAPGSGNTSDDIIISANCTSVQLRAERAGGGNGRVYTIQVVSNDQYGNIGTATYQVHIPHNAGGTAQGGTAACTVTGNCSSTTRMKGYYNCNSCRSRS